MSDEVLARFVTSYFVAGALFDRTAKRCTRAAPIIGWMRGKHWREVAKWCDTKRVQWEILEARP